MTLTMIQTKNQNNDSLKAASRGAGLGIIVYLFLAVIKLSMASFFYSDALRADGLNNLSDIISSMAIYIGLYLAKQPADTNHRFGHEKYEPIASFIVSLIMFTIGIEVITSSITRFRDGNYLVPNLSAIWVTIPSLIVLYLTYRSVNRLAIKTNSMGLKASAKDMMNDIFISASTLIAIVAGSMGYTIVDTIVAVIVGAVIIRTAYDIFRESTFTLSDGFDEEALKDYRAIVLKHPRVHDVSLLRGRLSGQKIYLDLTIKIDGKLSVTESHYITEEIEQILAYHYQVHDVDVHVEPYFDKR